MLEVTLGIRAPFFHQQKGQGGWEEREPSLQGGSLLKGPAPFPALPPQEQGPFFTHSHQAGSQDMPGNEKTT